MNKKKNEHDTFFKTAFGNPKLMAQLLRIAARRNTSLREFLNAINPDSLQPMPGEAPREGLRGAADLVFRVNLKGSKRAAKLHVGLILEHKSYPDNKVLRQLMRYYFEVVLQKAGNIPTVAIVVYNGNIKWNPLKRPAFLRPYPQYPDYFNRVGYPFVCEFIDIGEEVEAAEFMTADPQLVLALLAMHYVFHPSERERFNAALENFMSLGREGALEFSNEVYLYLLNTIPEEDTKQFMDTEEIYRNKGYTSIAEAREQRYKQTCSEYEAKLADKDAEIADKDAEIAHLREALAAANAKA